MTLKLVLGTFAAATAFAAVAYADDADLVAKGAYVARLGDCAACHTAPGGKPFAGGLAIKSDLGTIYSTNITPDASAGIGGYSETDFARAVREGVRKDGSHLYPAMPYPSYNKLSDADIHALYAYFTKGVEPVAEKAPETALGFPFSQRWGMMFWNLAFDSAQGFTPDAKASDEVNRGAYIVEGPGHCGSCHTPRGIGMQEKAYDASSADYLAGGNLNGWDVPSLRAGGKATRGVASWTDAEIVEYLASGRNDKAAVGGEMTSVIAHSSSYMTPADLKAITAFLRTLPAAPQASVKSADAANATTAKLTAAVNLTSGERLYIDNCGACHFVDGKGGKKIFPVLDGASVVNSQSPVGLIHTILKGAATPSVPTAPSVNLMPGFEKRLSDQDVADLASFVRSAWTNDAPKVTAQDVAKVRASLSEN